MLFKRYFLLLMLPGLGGWVHATSVLPEVQAKQRYMVVASREAAGQEAWLAVINALREKYDAALILYPDGQVDAVLPELKKIHPRYAAFVTPPDKAGRGFVAAIHRLTRKLDDDPYTDLRWGILTGYDAADALRIARHREPLIIRSAASSMGPAIFKDLAHGFASSEVDESVFFIKQEGGEVEKHPVAPDPVKRLVEAFNTQSPDVFVTSGHATERDWQVIYNKNLGSFRCRDGQLFGLNSKGERFDIHSPGPKIYMPMGNCLIGHIPDKNCMAAAWMHTGGVYQMFGYTAVTFHGYMGWGMGTYLNNQYSLSEAFFFNNQSLIRELWQEFPGQAHIEFDNFDHRGISRLAQKHKIRGQKLMGHLWDRDVVSFLGDPAWVARYPLDDPAWKATYRRDGEMVTVKVDILKDGTWGNRPLGIPFPERLARMRGITCSHDVTPVVTDDFALLPVMGQPRKAGETIQLTFSAYALDVTPTSGTAAPVVIKTDSAISKTDTESTGFDLKSLGLSPAEARRVAVALRHAKQNRPELLKALQLSGKDEVKDMSYLVTNMPLRDLVQLSADYLLENVRYAQKGFNEAPWREELSPELYREYILPYASLTEKREDWRKMFYEKVKPLLAGHKRPGEAAVALNQAIFDLFNVQFHATKRPKPDQGPLESIQAKYASCTGLSILLVDACRAVGIPARIAGVAEWTNGPGNHTWVEVWDRGWHCLGASESKALNEVWFKKGAAEADAADPMKRIYASRFSRTGLRFPMAWDPYADYVPAEDVSAAYKAWFGTAAADPE